MPEALHTLTSATTMTASAKTTAQVEPHARVHTQVCASPVLRVLATGPWPPAAQLRCTAVYVTTDSGRCRTHGSHGALPCAVAVDCVIW